jgi:hypothetical protein
MEGRRLAFIGRLVTVLFVTLSISLYLFVMVHFGFNWTLLLIFVMLFLAALLPGCNAGYGREDAALLVPDGTSYEDFLNGRDCWRLVGGFFYLFCYVIPIILWVHYDGTYPPTWGVHVTFWANCFAGLAFVTWYRLQVYSKS